MTPAARVELIIYCIIILSAVYFAAWSYWLNRMKRKPQPLSSPEIAFRWPDEVELRYCDAAGNVVANRVYRIERRFENLSHTV